MQRTTQNPPSCLTEAVRLARAGFHVGITAPLSKRPHPRLMAKQGAQRGGVWRATTDEAQVTSWWETCPEGGLFVAPRRPLIAVDVDNVDCLEERCGKDVVDRLLKTFPSTRTPSGGLHLWMRLPAPRKSSSLPRNLAFGEMIYEGFYALCPPSAAMARSGEKGDYTVISRLPDHVHDVPVVQERDLDLLIHGKGPASRQVVEGERHNYLLRLALDLAHRGESAEQISRRLQEANRDFLPPYEGEEAQREIGGTVDWVLRNVVKIREDLHASPIKLLTMEELANRPAPTWLIPGLIPDHSLGFLIGRPGDGKSFFLQELAQSISRNVGLFGDVGLKPTRHGWVLCLLPEACLSWAVRIRTYCDYHHVSYSDQFACCLQPLDLGDSVSWAGVMTTIHDEIAKRGAPPVLVVVDTMASAISGRDENSQADMTPVMAHMQELVALGCTVVLAHHPAKYTDVYRGSTVMLGSCDWMISIIRSGEIREFRAEKLRDVEKITSKAFVIRKHGESAVCVGTEAAGPWSILEAVSREHASLREALLVHGLAIPGEPRRTPESGDITATEGVPLKAIKATWRRLDPIRPANRVDPQGYKAADRARTTALLRVVCAMVDAGLLKVIRGRLSKSIRNLDSVLRQEVRDENG